MKPSCSAIAISVLLAVSAQAQEPDCGWWDLTREKEKTGQAWKNATVEMVTTCLKAGADLEARDKDGNTPLHWAARTTGTPAVIDALLKAGADPKVRDDAGDTPLHWAAWSTDNPSVIEMLLKAEADLKARRNSGHTPLHVAARRGNGNPDVIKALINAGADVNARENTDEKATPLHGAWKTDNPAVIEALINAGADLEAVTESGSTPSHWAAQNDNPAIIKALIKAGADLEARNKLHSDTPLHMAARRNSNPAVIEALLKAGADPNGQNDYGWTPLLMAAGDNKNPAVTEALLKAGADPNGQQHEYGLTLPLSVAAEKNNPAVLEVLLAAGAEVNAQGTDGVTPLHRAAELNGNPAAIEVLLKAGADPEAREEDGDTPLHRAAYNDNPAIIKALINTGADLEARNKDGETPLHRAAGAVKNQAGIDVVDTLLKAGADPEARGTDGDTPLHVAATNSEPAGIEALLKAGANPNARDRDGKTPWDRLQSNEKLKGSAAYWKLNDARFQAPQPTTPPPTRPQVRPAALAGTTHAGMRGQVVCGVPPDEAALVTVEVDGRWVAYTPNARQLGYSRSEEGALGGWDATYVCEVEYLHGNIVTPQKLTGRFYRLHRPLAKSQTSPGGVTAEETDVRERIIGLAVSPVPEWVGGKECVRIQFEKHVYPDIWYYSVTNTCDKEVWISIVERNNRALEDKGFWVNRILGGYGLPVGHKISDGNVVDTNEFIKLEPKEDDGWSSMHWDKRDRGDPPRPQVAFCFPGLEAVDPEKSDIRPGGELFYSGQSRCQGFPEKDENWHYVNF